VHDSVVAKRFWFHRAFDRIDVGDSVGYSVAVFGAFLVVFLFVEWRGAVTTLV